ncbi:uncharacterized protein C8Q71DRAFT_830229 [Rhodofomes roseus]|uniref:RRM domain-containing protein n=1 Tax=Rhodofomes roseus TaxID=34475 RepID=A0ABQ8KMS6_9APHY|nr:uncharacterized protein C8Q71DRAFT_830229 [Rhodofomes roseus]KAH9839718.1 hypothetical protein C8Q71DRAFT_830229 [Rhodofomes roseus]
MDEIITKRLHVSGLTPAITPDDLAKRLGSFGTIKAMDGFGSMDAVGQPRKFGYITLEATKKNLGRCMNLLSGATWKGAKLRLGEARPDYRERIAQEHEAVKRAASEAAGDRPRKRQRLPRGVQGVHAADMSLVTPENVASRAGWRVTPLGRLIRPIRVRPDHPLPDPQEISATGKGKAAEKAGGRKKKRVKEPPTRAQRRRIDPTIWGSEHLKGMFLEDAVVASAPINIPAAIVEGSISDESTSDESEDAASDSGASESDDSSSAEQDATTDGHLNTTSGETKTSRRVSPALRTPEPAIRIRTGSQDHTQNDLREETQKSLGLLQALFGEGDDDWGDKESVGSIIEEDDRTQRTANAAVEDLAEQGQEEDAVDEESVEDVIAHAEQPVPGPSSKASAPVQVTKLKDLFAPREEDVGFSLLGHLDLDLELDDEVDLHLPSQPQAQSEPAALPLPTAIPSLPSFDPKAPLFFPLPAEERNRGRVYDVLDPTNWRTWFYRTDSEEEVQKRWEEAKGELTSGWKRRHREAVKSRRRRGGGPGDAEL